MAGTGKNSSESVKNVRPTPALAPNMANIVVLSLPEKYGKYRIQRGAGGFPFGIVIWADSTGLGVTRKCNLSSAFREQQSAEAKAKGDF